MGGAEGVWGATTVFAGDWFNGTRKQLLGEVLSRKRGQQQALPEYKRRDMHKCTTICLLNSSCLYANHARKIARHVA